MSTITDPSATRIPRLSLGHLTAVILLFKHLAFLVRAGERVNLQYTATAVTLTVDVEDRGDDREVVVEIVGADRCEALLDPVISETRARDILDDLRGEG